MRGRKRNYDVVAFGKRNKLTAQLKGRIAKDALHIAYEKHGCQVLN